MRSRLAFFGRRLAQGLPIILLIATCNFFFLHLAPGDPASVLAGEAGAATEEYMRQLRAQFDLDRPLHQQYVTYLWRLLHLDLGHSFRYGASNLSLILDRLGATLILMVGAVVISITFGVLLGMIAAVHRRSAAGFVILFLAIVAYAAPLFWLSLMAIVLFAIKLGLVPTSGMTTVGAGYTGLRHAMDVSHHAILPACCLSLFYIALYTRLMRTAVIETLDQLYVATARAKGVGQGRVLFRHVLRNAVLPVVTMAGVQVSGTLGGSVIVESVFGWPGLGLLAFDALFSRDLNLLLAILLLSSVVVVLANVVVDMIYSLIDPRLAIG